MADPDQYYGVGIFSDLWKKGEMPTEARLIKGTSLLFDYLMRGTDSIKDFHGVGKSMYDGLEIRVVRISKEFYDKHHHKDKKPDGTKESIH